MELHKAIQQIIKAHGLSTLQEPRLLNMLNDYHAYKSNPATKFVVSSLFNEGVISLLMSYGKWSIQCDQLVHHVSRTTGFQPDLVSVVLKSFAYGLGWIGESDITAVPNNPNPPAPKPIAPPQKPYNGDLANLIEVKDNVRLLLGVELSCFSVERDYDNDFVINCEMKRVAKPAQKGYYQIIAAFYDTAGKIRISETLYYGEKIPQYEAISQFFTTPSNLKKKNDISKIVIYAKIS